MFKKPHYFILSLRSLQRNNFQAFLAIIGVSVGVCALVISVALARGARESINEQLMSIGANMIVVTAGNYQVKRPQDSGIAPADHGYVIPDRPKSQTTIPYNGTAKSTVPSLRTPNWIPLYNLGNEAGFSGQPFLVPVHYEDDPNAEHDHPTAAERLGDTMAGLGAAATLTLDDATAIRDQLDGINFVASGVHENARIVMPGDGGRSWFTRLHGTEPRLPDLRSGWTFSHGRFFNEREHEEGQHVIVLGQVVADRLFGRESSPVGETVLLWNQSFEVVGVIGSQAWAAQPSAGDDQFDAVYVPVTAVHTLLNLSKLNTITASARSSGETSRLAQEITTLLRQRHGITEQLPDDFTVRTQAEQVLGQGLPPQVARVVAGNMNSVDSITMEQLSGSLERANTTMMLLLVGVAGISLLVGGIGVVNLLLLSVTQRTNEVGLRLALGAFRKDIAWQFVVEAILMTLIGGLIGLFLGISLVTSFESIFGWAANLSSLSMITAITASILLGVIAGAYPAYRAANLDPIKALHHE